ncbi:MAG: NfeD family protein [Deltaproteobacteria bacterium]|nr:NfeD family protein [Deltaproteobacteria bacterium]
MKPNHESKWRVLLTYSLFQLPELGLIVLGLLAVRYWFELSDWIFWAIIIGWVGKDIVLFPFVRKSFDDAHQGHPYSLVGLQGVVQRKLSPSGMVRIKNELWRAVLKGDGPVVGEGSKIRVVDQQNLILLVEPVEPEKEDPGNGQDA